MTSKPKRFVFAVAVVLVLLVVVVGGYALVKGVDRDPALVGSLVTAFAAVLAVVVGRDREMRLQLRQQHRTDIAPMYKQLIDVLRETTPEEAMEFFKKFHAGLILDAPTEVIEAWLIWSRTLVPADIGQNLYRPLFAATENVLLAIRKDLGHDNSKLQFGDLQRIYLQGELGDMLFGPLNRPLPLSLLGDPLVPVPTALSNGDVGHGPGGEATGAAHSPEAGSELTE